MKELFWRVELTDGTIFTGREEVRGGELRIVCDLPEGHIRSVTAEMLLPLTGEDRVFINGFQSWTNCPEYTENDSIRGLSHLPKAGVRYFGLDRYGDNYFVDYPQKKGVLHGESWAYARRGEEFRLVGSLDETMGYTLIRYDFPGGRLRLERDCAGLRCGGSFHAFDLFFARGGEDQVFDAWFAAMGVQPRTREKIAGYSSWYNRYQNIDESCIRSDLEACAGMLQRGDLFQIDDGWEPKVGDWLAPDAVKFPHGLKPLVEDIHSRGLRAGLWLAPFGCQKGSEILKEHPDWMVKGPDGKPWYCGVNWGGFYSLDIDVPEVRDYIRRVFRLVLDEWGFDLVKLDFLYGAAPFGSETESRAGRMIRALDFLREVCGDKLILGCGVPMMPAFGRVDYCRIGCDVGLDWDGSWLMQQTHRERVSTRQSLQNTVFRRQLNGRAFGNDPDVFFLRTSNMKLKPEEKRILSEINALLGNVWLTSDDMGEYGDRQRARYRELRELREADDIRVSADEEIQISYSVRGEKCSLTAKLGKKR